jgi:PadR family transcriptional regulator, regulatory protein PadR
MPRRPNISRQTLAVLFALLHSDGWRHGVSLSRETGLKPGTLYPLLLRLHESGYLESEWQAPDKPGRPPRHAYRLNAAGRALAEERLGGANLVPKPA